jgi:hypothetical protein
MSCHSSVPVLLRPQTTLNPSSEHLPHQPTHLPGGHPTSPTLPTPQDAPTSLSLGSFTSTTDQSLAYTYINISHMTFVPFLLCAFFPVHREEFAIVENIYSSEAIRHEEKYQSDILNNFCHL